MRSHAAGFGIWMGILLMGAAPAAFCARAGLPKEAQELAAQSENFKSYKAHFDLNTKEADGKPFLLSGTLAYRKSGQRRLEIHEGDAKEDTQLLVFDGQVEWQYFPQNSVVYKIKNPPESPGPHRPFAEVKPESVRFVKKLNEEGISLLRFEAEPEPASVEGAPIPVKTVQLDVGEADGMLRKMVMLDEKGETVLTQRFTDLEVNGDLPDDQFTFTPPEGVSVTEMPPAPQAQGEEGPKQ